MIKETQLNEWLNITHLVNLVNHFDDCFWIILLNLDHFKTSKTDMLIALTEGHWEDVLLIICHLRHFCFGNRYSQVFLWILKHVLDPLLNLRDDNRVLCS